MSQSITLPVGRASFPHIAEPADYQGDGNFRYSMTVLLPAGADLTPLKAAIKAVIEETWPNPAKRPRIKSPIHDQGDHKYDGYEPGAFYIRAKRKPDFGPPPVVGADTKVNLPPESVYPGQYVRVAIEVFGYTKSGGGIGFGLSAIQAFDKGDRLGGTGISVEDAFPPLEGTETVADKAPEKPLSGDALDAMLG